jgi:hypothetical protein
MTAGANGHRTGPLIIAEPDDRVVDLAAAGAV